ncbi:MAG: molecular chaperone DnaK [Candidatus Calescibacterium sp.]|nr:molecular chaperone DnaK [Candidatus Calescibacterium sp.]MDW8132678.1 molecular chaperone DnaK [Candidatus Calescibacterium sp.]
MPKAVGIDLGTTNSVISYKDSSGNVVVIPNAEGSRLTPSVVAFKGNEIIVGEHAKRQAILNPENTVISIKRKMGSDHKVKIESKEYTPEQISAFILQKLKRDAEAYLGEPIQDAVITVPAYFNNPQREATKNAGVIAGLNVLRIINEPTAAALAYGLDKQDQILTVLVFDLGGGTFDVSVLEIGQGVFQVKATSGDNHLGGDDWDHKIIEWILEEFKKEHGIDLRNEKSSMQRIREAAENAKKELSIKLETEINLPYIYADEKGPKHIQLKLTRSRFEEMSKDLMKRLEDPCRRVLDDLKMTPDKIDRVLLVGGSTRMPMVQEFVRRFFGKEPAKDINPDEAVAIGAAIQASIIKGETKDIVLVDITPLSLGVEVMGGMMHPLIPRNTPIPTQKSEIFTTPADFQTTVEVHVLQGERTMARDNISLGRFILSDIPPAPRGVPQIEVTFEIDANGILNVTAKDKATGKSQKITITGATKLSKEDIDRMIRDAQQYAEQDRKYKELVEARNRLDHIIYLSEKSLREYPNADANLKSELEKEIEESKKVMNAEDVIAINRQYDKLQMALSKFTQAAYAPAGASASTGQTTSTENQQQNYKIED